MKLSFDPVFLTVVCQPVLENEIGKWADLIQGMWEICDGRKCIGLAANQFGVNQQIMVINCQGFKQVFINPVIEKVWGGISGMREECLSFPNKSEWVNRWKRVRIVAVDAQWNRLRFKPRGLVSRVVQHEYDHLHGMTMFDKANGQKRGQV